METKNRTLSSSEDDDLCDRVACLFSEMYKYMDTKGLLYKLTNNGIRK